MDKEEVEMHEHGRHCCCCREHSREHGHDCCCERHEHHHHHDHRSHGERHHHESHRREHRFHRHFATRDERLAEMEAYLRELQAEIKAVEEHIANLRAAS